MPTIFAKNTVAGDANCLFLYNSNTTSSFAFGGPQGLFQTLQFKENATEWTVCFGMSMAESVDYGGTNSFVTGYNLPVKSFFYNDLGPGNVTVGFSNYPSGYPYTLGIPSGGQVVNGTQIFTCNAPSDNSPVFIGKFASFPGPGPGYLSFVYPRLSANYCYQQNFYSAVAPYSYNCSVLTTTGNDTHWNTNNNAAIWVTADNRATDTSNFATYWGMHIKLLNPNTTNQIILVSGFHLADVTPSFAGIVNTATVRPNLAPMYTGFFTNNFTAGGTPLKVPSGFYIGLGDWWEALRIHNWYLETY